MTRVLVYGFGLIGGSLGSALRAHGGFDVTAVDRREVLELPEARAAADRCVPSERDSDVAGAIEQSELVVLAAPVAVICERLPWVLERAHAVTDCGSTKRHIVAAARRAPRAARFVPGHPMAGLPEGGIRNASSELFRQQHWLLCPEGCDADALALVERVITAVGAVSVHLSPEQHDAAVARTSHLPQLLASTLSVLVEQHDARQAAGPAFERTTRGAGGPVSMWRDVFATNGDEISRALRELCAALEPLAAELAEGRTECAEALLGEARRSRDA